MWNVLPTTAFQTKSASAKKLRWGYDCILFWRQIHVVSAIYRYSPEAKIFIVGGAFQFRAISEETTYLWNGVVVWFKVEDNNILVEINQNVATKSIIN